MLVSWLFLLASAWGAWFTWNAWRPLRRGQRLAAWSFASGWLTGELALHHVAWQVAATVVFAALGALEHGPGRLGLAITAASVAGLLAFLGLVNAQDKIGFGPYFSLGPTSSWIREAKTTLVLPEVPSPQKDRLALWPGMGTSGGDLIQALAVSFSDPAA